MGKVRVTLDSLARMAKHRPSKRLRKARPHPAKTPATRSVEAALAGIAHDIGTPLTGVTRPVELICFVLIIANAVFFGFYVLGWWIVAADGGSLPVDFVNVWAAGRQALEGHPAAAYDWPTHTAMAAALGHPFVDNYLPWLYPPTFLSVAATLALMPYAAAYVVWTFGTFPAYLAAVRGIIGDRTGYFLAAAFPGVVHNFIVGQNGFLSTALLGGTLLFIEQRPMLAGVLLGLLTYKPHLGLLFPIALAASGHWRVFIVAGIVAALMAIASWGAFGTETWAAFFTNIGHTPRDLLSADADFAKQKLQTAFGLVRTLGGSEPLAWSVQAAVALVAAGAIAVLWRSRADYEVKAAALSAAALLATPYLYIYDLTVLTVPLAFLWRLGRARGFLTHELAGIGLACLLVLIFPFVIEPVGFAAVLLVAALIARRYALQPDRTLLEGSRGGDTRHDGHRN